MLLKFIFFVGVYLIIWAFKKIPSLDKFIAIWIWRIIGTVVLAMGIWSLVGIPYWYFTETFREEFERIINKQDLILGVLFGIFWIHLGIHWIRGKSGFY